MPATGNETSPHPLEAYGRSYDEEQETQSSEIAASDAKEGSNNEGGGGAAGCGAKDVEAGSAEDLLAGEGAESREDGYVGVCLVATVGLKALVINRLEDTPTSSRATNVGSGLC